MNINQRWIYWIRNWERNLIWLENIHPWIILSLFWQIKKCKNPTFILDRLNIFLLLLVAAPILWNCMELRGAQSRRRVYLNLGSNRIINIRWCINVRLIIVNNFFIILRSCCCCWGSCGRFVVGICYIGIHICGMVVVYCGVFTWTCIAYMTCISSKNYSIFCY